MKRWLNKFNLAWQGVAAGVRNQDSFAVHLPAAALALGLGGWLRISNLEWALVALAIGLVLALELINSALEALAKGLTAEQNQLVGRALDTAAGAVLVASAASLAVGVLIFGPRLWSFWSGGN